MRCQRRRQLTDRQSLSIPSRHRRIVFNQISQLMKLENPELCVAFGPAISRHKNSSTSLLANCKLSLRLAKRDNRATRKSPAEEKIPMKKKWSGLACQPAPNPGGGSACGERRRVAARGCRLPGPRALRHAPWPCRGALSPTSPDAENKRAPA
jgi:hypothetical protein